MGEAAIGVVLCEWREGVDGVGGMAGIGGTGGAWKGGVGVASMGAGERCREGVGLLREIRFDSSARG